MFPHRTTVIKYGGKVLTHHQLRRDIRGPSHAEDSHYVHIHMGHLWRKIEDDPSQPRHLVTESGVGYRFVA